MVKLSVAVMSHPVRIHVLNALLKRLGDKFPVAVVNDIAPLWVCYRKSWRARPSGATHHLVLADDADPCLDMLEGLANAIEAQPHFPIGVYANYKVCEEARARGDSWAIIYGGVWGNGVCFPVEMIEPMIAWVDSHVLPSFKHDDSRVNMYLEAQGIPVYQTVPSLIDHLLPSESLLGQSNKTRKARVFTYGSALSIDWMKGLTEPLKTHRRVDKYDRSFLIEQAKR